MKITPPFFVRFASFLILLSAINCFANQTDLDTEKAELIQVFTNDNLFFMEEKARQLEDMGYSDPAIFDLVEKQILTHINTSSKGELDSVAWLVRALGFSGNVKYIDTLNKVSSMGEKKLARHAVAALEDMPRFTQWNSVISKDLGKAPAGRIIQKRILNLLQSGNPEMVRSGVKQVYNRYARGAKDKELLDTIQRLLLSTYQSDTDNDVHQDSLAWMCKTLANSSDPAYLPTVQEVAKNAQSKKLRKYASKYAKLF